MLCPWGYRMNDNQERKLYDILYRGDPRACMLLGPQKRPAAGENIRRSCFVHVLYVGGRYLLFHTLTRRLLQACGVL